MTEQNGFASSELDDVKLDLTHIKLGMLHLLIPVFDGRASYHLAYKRCPALLELRESSFEHAADGL